MTNDELAFRVIKAAELDGTTIVTAESCTAGALAHILSKPPGAGIRLQGGFVVYTKEMKTSVLQVPQDLMREKTAVCREVAQMMAIGALNNSSATWAVAITGVLGPEPDEDDNPVGRVFCAVADKMGGIRLRHNEFGSCGRDEILHRTLATALGLLLEACRDPSRPTAILRSA